MSENEFLPLILLFLFGGFAVASALLKTRARVTALLGVTLAVLEGLSGMALMAAALPMSGSLQTASRVGILTAAMVALSSTVHMLKVRDRSRAREASEGKRLYAAVKYGVGGSTSTPGGVPVELDGPAEPDALAIPSDANAPDDANGPDDASNRDAADGRPERTSG